MAERPVRKRLTLPRQARIRRSSEFQHILRHGRRASDGFLQLWACPGAPGNVRLGLIVGRRLGSAVRRNYLKRLIREAFRLRRHELPSGLDLLVSPVRGADLTRSAAERSLLALGGRVARIIEHNGPESTPGLDSQHV